MFGAGKFKEAVPDEMKKTLCIVPTIKTDRECVLFQADATREGEAVQEKYQSLHTTLTSLIADGLLREPPVVPFHIVSSPTAVSPSARKVYEIVPTGERAWVPSRAESKEPSKDKKPLSYTNLGALMKPDSMAALPNNKVRLTWIVRRHELGVLRLVYPALVFSVASEFKAPARFAHN